MKNIIGILFAIIFTSCIYVSCMQNNSKEKEQAVMDSIAKVKEKALDSINALKKSSNNQNQQNTINRQNILIPNNEFYLKGLKENKNKKYRDAIVDLTKAIEINPKLTDAYYERGNAKSNIGDYRGAIEDYKIVDQISSNYKNVYINEGRAYGTIRDYFNALGCFELVIKFDPHNAIGYYYRGLTKINLLEKDEGCLDLSKAGEMGCAEAYDAIKKYCKGR